MKGTRLSNGNNTLLDGIHADVDPFVKIGITASGLIFNYDNKIDLYWNTKSLKTR